MIRDVVLVALNQIRSYFCRKTVQHFRSVKAPNIFSAKNGSVFAYNIQLNFNGLNTDGLFTTAVSNSFLIPWEKIPLLQISDNLG